jgi:hypothetical protein
VDSPACKLDLVFHSQRNDRKNTRSPSICFQQVSLGASCLELLCIYSCIESKDYHGNPGFTQLGGPKTLKYIHTAKYNNVKKTGIPALQKPKENTPSVSEPAGSLSADTLSLRDISSKEVLKYLEPTVARMAPPSHRFGKINEAKAFLKLVYESGDWTERTENEGISISKLKLTDLELPFIRGDGELNGEWSIEEVVSVISNASARAKCINSLI